jgi:hypothetical protein
MLKTSVSPLVLVAALSATSTLAVGATQQFFRGGEATQEVRLKSWRLDKDVHGYQVVAPFSLMGSADLNDTLSLDAGLRTAWIKSENLSTVSRGELNALSDTILSLSFTEKGFGAFRPFVSVDFNIPTGQTKLRGARKNAVMDPDLVQVIRLGEGFNSNLSAGATWNEKGSPWTVAGAVGYNLRGSYVPDGDLNEVYDPGDQLTAMARIQYFTKSFYAAINAIYTKEQESKLAGFNYFRPGDLWEVNAEATYVLDEVSSISASAFWSTAGRNKYLDFFTDALIRENVNGNGDYYFGQLAYSRTVSDTWAVTLAATYGVRESNKYLPAQDLFIPKRTYWDLRASADWKLEDNLKLSFDAGVGQVRDDATPFNPKQDFDTFSAGVALSFAL